MAQSKQMRMPWCHKCGATMPKERTNIYCTACNRARMQRWRKSFAERWGMSYTTYRRDKEREKRFRARLEA